MSAVVDPTHRMLGMESDLANRNFAGAMNPDDALWVQFTMKAMPDSFQSQNAGRPIFRDELWVEIRVPGRQDLTIERPAEEGDKVRFHRQWAFFQQTHSADGQQVGTPLSQWPLLRPSQIEELRAMKFHTVEQIALASDEQINRLGMLAGMSPFSFRDRAKLYLDTANDNAAALKAEEEKKALQAQLQAEKEAREALEAKHAGEMAELRALIAQATAPKRRGRPPKETVVSG